MEASEPGTDATWARLRPRAGRHRLQDGQPAHLVWMGGGERERRRPAPVLPGQQHRTKPKLGDKPVQIGGAGGDVVGQRPWIRIPEPA